MSATVTGSAGEGEPDDIIRLLDKPVAGGLCQKSSSTDGRRVPTCALIMLSVVLAVGLLAYGVWPQRAAGTQPWKTRIITLPNGAGTAYHRDRVVDSFFGKFERRIDIDGRYKTGTVWLPAGEHSGSTHGDFVWHEAGPFSSGQGPWLEINDMTADYLVDMREIVLYRLHQVNGQICAVVLEEGQAGGDNAACSAANIGSGSAMDISKVAQNWSTQHLGMLDRRSQFVPGESVGPSRLKHGSSLTQQPARIKKTEMKAAGCRPPPRRGHVLRGPPRMEYIGVSRQSRGSKCPPPRARRHRPGN